MSPSSTESGFTLTELLVVLVISAVILAGFSSFYYSEQRALRHHEIELETSQGLRMGLEQITRDLRSARKDAAGANPTFLTATANAIEFQLDANDDGVITASSPDERKGFSRSGTDLLQLDAATNSTNVLAENVSALVFTYRDCNGANPATVNDIASVSVSVTVTRPVVGGLPFTRTETENVRLRNKVCP